MKALQAIALTFTIIGAINWGLVGLFDFNLVALIFGGSTGIFTKIIYIIVGICGIINIKLLIDVIEDRD